MNLKGEIAAKMAEELWDKYMKATEPSKRRVYGLRYEFWANVRDNNKEATCDDSERS